MDEQKETLLETESTSKDAVKIAETRDYLDYDINLVGKTVAEFERTDSHFERALLWIKYLLLFTHSVVSNSFATAWMVTCRAPLSMGFPRQEYWAGLPFPSPGDPEIGRKSPELAGGFFTTEAQGRPSHDSYWLSLLPSCTSFSFYPLYCIVLFFKFTYLGDFLFK